MAAVSTYKITLAPPPKPPEESLVKTRKIAKGFFETIAQHLGFEPNDLCAAFPHRALSDFALWATPHLVTRSGIHVFMPVASALEGEKSAAARIVLGLIDRPQLASLPLEDLADGKGDLCRAMARLEELQGKAHALALEQGQRLFDQATAFMGLHSADFVELVPHMTVESWALAMTLVRDISTRWKSGTPAMPLWNEVHVTPSHFSNLLLRNWIASFPLGAFARGESSPARLHAQVETFKAALTPYLETLAEEFHDSGRAQIAKIEKELRPKAREAPYWQRNLDVHYSLLGQFRSFVKAPPSLTDLRAFARKAGHTANQSEIFAIPYAFFASEEGREVLISKLYITAYRELADQRREVLEQGLQELIPRIRAEYSDAIEESPCTTLVKLQEAFELRGKADGTPFDRDIRAHMSSLRDRLQEVDQRWFYSVTGEEATLKYRFDFRYLFAEGGLWDHGGAISFAPQSRKVLLWGLVHRLLTAQDRAPHLSWIAVREQYIERIRRSIQRPKKGLYEPDLGIAMIPHWQSLGEQATHLKGATLLLAFLAELSERSARAEAPAAAASGAGGSV